MQIQKRNRDGETTAVATPGMLKANRVRSGKTGTAKKKVVKKEKEALKDCKLDDNKTSGRTPIRKPNPTSKGKTVKFVSLDEFNWDKEFSEAISMKRGEMALILSRKLTDEEMITKLEKKFPGQTIRLSLVRADLNAGRRKFKGVAYAGDTLTPLDRVKGKMVIAAPTKRTKATKILRDNDPLLNVAGIDIKNEEIKKSVKKKTPVKKVPFKRAVARLVKKGIRKKN